MKKSNEDLLRELIDAAYNSGYDAACMEKAVEWGRELGVIDGDIIGKDARVGWERHLDEAIAAREAAHKVVLQRMQDEPIDATLQWGESIDHLVGRDLWRRVVDVAYNIVEYQLSDSSGDEPINLEAIVEEWQERQASRMTHEEVDDGE